jgi:WD40 repeat protein
VVLAWQKELADEQRAEAQAQRAAADDQRAEAQAQRAEAHLEGARAALAQRNLLETRGKLRFALESADTPSARALWWQLRDDPLVWRRKFGAVIYDVAASRDGKYVAVACQDRSVYVLDSQTRTIKALRGHGDQVIAVAFSHDGKKLASGDWSGNVRLWDARTGKQTHALAGHEAAVHGVSFSPDGRQLASASQDKTVRLWDVHTGKQQLTLTGHTAAVRSVSFSPDGRQLASASHDTSVRLWDAHTGEQQLTLTGHTAAVRGVSFSPDGRQLASASSDKTVQLWDARSGRRQRTLTGHTAVVRSVSFGPEGRWVASGGNDKTVRLWTTGNAQLQPTLTGHTAAVNSVSFSPDGRRLASGSADKTVRLWDTITGEQERTLRGHTDAVHSVSFSPDGRRLASGSQDKTVRLWDAQTATLQRTLNGHADSVQSISFSPDGSRLASGSADNTIRLWDASTGQPKRTLSAHGAVVHRLSFSPDGQRLASGSQDKTIRLWHGRTTRLQRSLEGHEYTVRGLSFSPDGSKLVSGSADNTVRLWDAITGEQKLVLEQPARVSGVDFHPDGRRIGVASSDGVPRIWDVETQQITVELVGHSSEVNSLGFSPDGKSVATSSDDNTVRLWDTDTGKPVWRAPLLLAAPPRLYSHQGWHRLEGGDHDDKTGRRASPGAPSEQARGQDWQAAIELRARFAEVTPSGELLCLQSFDKSFELWSRADDTRLQQQSVPGMAELRAAAGGCLVRSVSRDGGGAFFFSPDGRRRALDVEGKVTAIGVEPGQVGAGHGELYVAAGDYVYVFDTSGARLGRHAASVGITSIARIDPGQLAVGFANGNIELVATGKTSKPSPPASMAYAFEQTPSSRVTRLLLGPMNTLIAGFADGTLSLYGWRDGKQLATARVHGPIEHLLLEKQKLYAASSLGQHLVWDLSALYAERCALLREVWKRVPVVWRDGHAVREPPPSDHSCSTTKGD